MGVTGRSCIKGEHQALINRFHSIFGNGNIPVYFYTGIFYRTTPHKKISCITQTPNAILDALITSKTRVKLLLKFFLNPENSAYLRGLETEFGESSNSIRLELNRLEKANLLHSSLIGNKRLFQVNQEHPLYNEINSIVRKFIGLDVIVENIAKRLGNLHAVYLTGEMVQGKDNEILDLVFVGDIDQAFLINCIGKAESFIKRKVRYLIYSLEGFENHKKNGNLLLIWQK